MINYTPAQVWRDERTGRYYVNPEAPQADVDVYHIQHEIEHGRAMEVRFAGEVTQESDLWEGAYVVFSTHVAKMFIPVYSAQDEGR